MTLCYSAQSLAKTAAAMAGVTPLTSPPLFMATFDPALLTGHDFLFFKLHGLEGQPYWYGDGSVTAISAEQIASVRIDGALVFAANCFGGERSPMVQALLNSGAACVVTGTGVNYAGQQIPQGADNLGRAWRWAMQFGATADAALSQAKIAAGILSPALIGDLQSFSVVGEKKARYKHAGKSQRR